MQQAHQDYVLPFPPLSLKAKKAQFQNYDGTLSFWLWLTSLSLQF